MENYTLAHFGAIVTENLNEYYRVTIDFNGGKLNLDLNFRNKEIDIPTLAKVETFLNGMDAFDKSNLNQIINNYDEKNSLVREYIDFHLEELPKNQLEQLIDVKNQKVSPEKQMLGKLKLERIGLYPDGAYNTESFAVFDYTFEGNIYVDGRRTITDQIIVLKTSENGAFNDMTWES
ncbi:DUF2004 domain-containing protein [Sphingobacterium sp. SRCM116780]|uniref:DUF2004 domain-containing protein n=1 Tax=Sphingobacterium sp. SRCM116780 TaxID=2907623 RepID=UPI001F3495DC|nr:DUF2004 domain-containing protein [Sphingobacterium sp. SRCM116780]UIR55075.1 DUF2004 domain-containing protein [Sphingobacterium sp. SRCM116780]